MPATLRQRIHTALDREGNDRLTWTQRALIFAIVASVSLTILGTEQSIVALAPARFAWGEPAFGMLFLVEYMIRRHRPDCDADGNPRGGLVACPRAGAREWEARCQ